MARHVLCLTVILAALATPAAALAEVQQFELISATAVAADWLPDGVKVFAYESVVVASQSGYVAFAGSMKGTDVVYGTNDKALFRRSPQGQTTMLLQSGDQVPGANQGAVWMSFVPTCMAEDGTLFFRGQLDWETGGGGVNLDNDYLAGRVLPDGTVDVLAREGSPVPGIISHVLAPLPGPSSPPQLFPRCTPDGQSVFTHPISSDGVMEFAIFKTENDGSTSVLYRTGDKVPGADDGAEFKSFSQAPRINPAGQVNFGARLKTGEGGQPVYGSTDTALFGPGADGKTTMILREGSPAPGSPDGTFQELDNIVTSSIAGDGTVYFITYFTYDNWYVDGALYRHSPALPGVLDPILVQNTPAPGMPEDWSVGYINSLTVNQAGQVSVIIDVRFGVDEWGEALQEEEALYYVDAQGNLELLFVTGDEVPGTDGAVGQTLNNQTFMNNNGEVLFTTGLKWIPPVDDWTDHCIARYVPGSGIEKFLREGDVVTVAEGDERTLKFPSMASSYHMGTSGTEGLPVVLRNDSTFVFSAAFYGAPPEPGFTSNGGLLLLSMVDDPCDPDVLDCNDNDACTEDSCDPNTGCIHDAVDCNDADACTVDSCDSDTGCLHTPVDCDDENPCTADSCEAAAGCQHLDVMGCCIDDADCQVGQECVESECLTIANPDEAETDVMTPEDVTEPYEEVVEAPDLEEQADQYPGDVTAPDMAVMDEIASGDLVALPDNLNQEDVPASEDVAQSDTTTVLDVQGEEIAAATDTAPATDLQAGDDDLGTIVPGKGGGGGGCSTSSSSPAAGWLLLALLSLLLLARYRRVA